MALCYLLFPSQNTIFGHKRPKSLWKLHSKKSAILARRILVYMQSMKTILWRLCMSICAMICIRNFIFIMNCDYSFYMFTLEKNERWHLVQVQGKSTVQFVFIPRFACIMLFPSKCHWWQLSELLTLCTSGLYNFLYIYLYISIKINIFSHLFC